jgi:hypothetical protein
MKNLARNNPGEVDIERENLTLHACPPVTFVPL